MILVAGSSNLDFVVKAAHIPRPGETVLGSGFQTFPGGKGANQAVACARAGGAATHFLTALGRDAFAEPLLSSLQSSGVTVHAVTPESVPTGTAFICVSESGENAITVAPGANALLAAEDWPGEHLNDAGVTHLLMQLETPLPTVRAYAAAARASGIRVVLNAAPAQALPDELLGLTDVLIVNEGELAALVPEHATICESLTRLGVPTVVVTLGARGSCMLDGKDWFFQPAFRVMPVDTTAAGDTFCGVLVAALGSGAGPEMALRTASAAAALTCTQMGAQSSIPDAIEVDVFLAQQPPTPDAAVQTLRGYCTKTQPVKS
jgi:ribokinase